MKSTFFITGRLIEEDERIVKYTGSESKTQHIQW